MNELDVKFDCYYTYDEMTARLRWLTAAYPELATMTSLAKTFQGRDVWAIEITNARTGPGALKPGYYIDGQIHADEHATSAAALYAVYHLLTKYGTDEEATRLVDTQAFYIVPRLNPDGAELSLVPPYYNWCGNGRYMPGADRIEGLIPDDIDGDGFIVWMRVPDKKGEWKKSATNPDILVQRAPGEEGGEYYRVYPEGTVRNYDGANVPIEKPFDGNMNRNFPINWSPQEYGAGTHPLSEPETQGLAKYILDHPNICGMCSYHTHGGVIIRPSMTKPDSALSARDVNIYKEIGKVGTALTGYPTASSYEEFTPDKSQVRRGGFTDWTYDELGIICFGTELWDIETAAGVPREGYYNLVPRNEEVMQKVYAYVKANMPDKGWRDWKPFDHPQLGQIEIGGMVDIWSYRNPPPHLLEDIVRQNVLFNLKHAAAAPQVKVEDVSVTSVGEHLFIVRAVVSNFGYLPTNLSDVAVAHGVAKPVRASIHIEGGELLMNPKTANLGNLAGRTERIYPWSPWGEQWNANSRPVEWLVRAKAGSSISVSSHSEKGGSHSVTVQVN
ncbi:M14 family metallopeptidase [Mesorhizobium sp. WSM4887]|uniref:M14 family metallopeptidase n=1 Tax=Mesorhizobium sp. WSM4887 TaxID=3038543 RepID=UPI002415D852|nr:M14 family metallopeptidase [Mesorhizobium sp. WSM4887]MDG4889736.1 M14 family metallopeptidase [Mesorhizobium sp. WSM4887]